MDDTDSKGASETDTPETESKEVDALLQLYQSSVSDQQHYENQCANLSTFVGVVALGAVGLIKIGEALPVLCVVLSLFVIGLGVFGACLSHAHCTNRTRQAAAAKAYLTRLHDLFNQLPECDLPRACEGENADLEVSRRSWRWLHWGLVLLGAVLLACSIGYARVNELDWFRKGPAEPAVVATPSPPMG